MGNDVFVVTGVTEGVRARLARIARGLRQIDVASSAKVNVCDVTALEKDRYLFKARKRKILVVLGLVGDDEEGGAGDG